LNDFAEACPKTGHRRAVHRRTLRWQKRRLKGSSDRFNYDYSDEKLQELGEKIKALSRQVKTVQAIMNNNYQDQGQRIAQTLMGLPKVKLTHHGLEIANIPEEWLEEAGMHKFVPSTVMYAVDLSAWKSALEVRIADIGPVRRSPGVPILKDSPETGQTARERVVSILSAFKAGVPLPPVGAVPLDGPYRYKLTHGVHRLYCSLAVGFTAVPVVQGFDRDLDM
jgi:hypothetical protein